MKERCVLKFTPREVRYSPKRARRADRARERVLEREVQSARVTEQVREIVLEGKPSELVAAVNLKGKPMSETAPRPSRLRFALELVGAVLAGVAFAAILATVPGYLVP